MNTLELHTYLSYIGYLGVAFFSLSGALAAAEKQLDILGYVFFAVLIGVGGGTTRDLLLNVPVFWISDPAYIYLGVIGGIAAYLFVGTLSNAKRALVWFDAIGLCAFSVIATAKAHALGHDPLICILMGSITATMGGLVRDVILNRDPLILGDEIYVTPSLLGGTMYLGLASIGLNEPAAMLASAIAAFCVRGGAIVFDWRLRPAASQ